MAAYLPKKTCNPTKWGCGQDFPETAAYFRPLTGIQRGCFNSYCHNCSRRKQQSRRKPKPPIKPHGAEKRCLGYGGCGRTLRESDFYRRQSVCKSCYNARWVPVVRERRERNKSLKLGHGLTDRLKGSFAADAEEFPAAAGHPVGSKDAMDELLEMA